MNDISSNRCPGCDSALGADSRFCQQCGLNVATTRVSSQISASLTNCPHCHEQINSNATFCWNCGKQISVVTTATGQRKNIVAIIVAIVIGIGLLYILLSRNSRNTAVGSSMNSLEKNLSSVINNATQPNTNSLTNAKVEQAVNQLTSNLRVGGSISVDGIQELPQENAARADLRFSNFQYKSDMAGSPVLSSRQAPEEPKVNDPNFYDKMYKYGTQQVKTRNYSGQGFAVLKHYSDGRWVLKEVHWEFNGWVGSVDIR
jgi:hypothetical protein